MPEPVVDDKAQKEAFDRYVVPEIEVLYRVARSITRNPTDAEDLVQDTMLRAYRAILRFDGRHPRAWLLTIMRNAQINRVRRKRPELLRDPDAAMERLADENSADLGPEGLVVESGYDAAVEKAVDSLPEKFRTVVELVDILLPMEVVCRNVKLREQRFCVHGHLDLTGHRLTQFAAV